MFPVAHCLCSAKVYHNYGEGGDPAKGILDLHIYSKIKLPAVSVLLYSIFPFVHCLLCIIDNLIVATDSVC